MSTATPTSPPTTRRRPPPVEVSVTSEVRGAVVAVAAEEVGDDAVVVDRARVEPVNPLVSEVVVVVLAVVLGT